MPVARQQILNDSKVGLQHWKSCFLSGPYREVISGTRLELSQFCTGVCEERTRAREAEETSTVKRRCWERLVTTQKAGKGLTGAVVICELCRLAVTLYLLVLAGRECISGQ
jgi:hypothetical protein